MDFRFSETNITGGFWHQMQEKNRNVTMQAVYDRFAETGRIGAFRFDWQECMDQKPHIFWDSDVAKWMEAAAYILQKHPDTVLENKVEWLIDRIEENQWEDGYFNIYYTVVEPRARFTNRDHHELYCAGHLMEAAVAYYYATGKDRFLRLMEKYADCIWRIFVEEKSAAFTTPGHQEIELALIRMFRATGKKKYLELALHFLNLRGTVEDVERAARNQSNIPVRELESAVGHSVRALYLYSAMADAAMETGDKALLHACHKLFEDITQRKMYITGGLGSTHTGEAFTIPYDLPAEHAYAETCAAIGLMFFAQRMLEMEHRSIFADVVERVIYNGMLSGLSLDGTAFFYENPLEITVKNRTRNNSTPEKQEKYPITERKVVFRCSCCPPNINRVLASVERYVYHRTGDTLYVDQFMESSFAEENVRVTQKTNYPVDGAVSLIFEGVKRAAIRVPSWCDEFHINAPYVMENGYAVIDAPSKVEVSFSMEPTLYTAHQEVDECAGKVALMRGPVVYCAEGADNPWNLHRISLSSALNAQLNANTLHGLFDITVDGYLRRQTGALYQKAQNGCEKVRVRLIPYFAFANRGESDMLVWLRQN